MFWKASVIFILKDSKRKFFENRIKKLKCETQQHHQHQENKVGKKSRNKYGDGKKTNYVFYKRISLALKLQCNNEFNNTTTKQ